MNNSIELINNLDVLIQSKGIKDQQIQQILLQLKEILEVEEPSLNQDDLIYVPMNQLVKEAKDLGGAEAMAFGYNVLGTLAVNSFTQNTLTLAVAGPVIEKIGFFFREYIKAVKEHKRTGKPIPQGFKENLSNGLKNLLVDIGIHDTIYTGLMAYGLSNQMFDARILAIFSFLIALPPAILVKYSGNELFYHIQKHLTKLNGLEREKYYEARFIFNNHQKPVSIFEETADKFGLSNYNMSTYHDKYFDHRIAAFSGRKGTLKFREIEDSVTGDKVSNLEIAHTLAKKDYLSKNGVYNFFYSSKEKGKKDLTGMDAEGLFRKFPYRFIIKKPSKEVSFEREIFFDDEVRITFDKITAPTNDSIKSVIEVKAYKDTKHLMEVMQFIMGKGNIRLTTQGKNELL
ncbi:MAG: hypothetical protein WAZ12_01245 [Candidatus Absconditicoccaceae bacterium]